MFSSQRQQGHADREIDGVRVLQPPCPGPYTSTHAHVGVLRMELTIFGCRNRIYAQRLKNIHEIDVARATHYATDIHTRGGGAIEVSGAGIVHILDQIL